MRKVKSAKRTVALKAHAIENLGAPVEVRRHPAARRLTLRVSRTRRAVIVTLPVQCDIDEAGTFINRNIAWVRERLESLPSAVDMRDGVFIPLRGAAHRIVFYRQDLGPQLGPGPGNGEKERRLSGDPCRRPRRARAPPSHGMASRRTLRDLEERVTVHAKRLKCQPKRIAVRDQSSRWGSCSTTGVLSFSWRLILAPPDVLDYVAAHEVAHLIEMNHGPRFWALVRKTAPNMDEQKAWLQIYGMDLHRYAS